MPKGSEYGKPSNMMIYIYIFLQLICVNLYYRFSANTLTGVNELARECVKHNLYRIVVVKHQNLY